MRACLCDCERDCVRAPIYSVRVRVPVRVHVDQARLILFVVLMNCNALCQPYCVTGVTESHILLSIMIWRDSSPVGMDSHQQPRKDRALQGPPRK